MLTLKQQKQRIRTYISLAFYREACNFNRKSELKHLKFSFF